MPPVAPAVSQTGLHRIQQLPERRAGKAARPLEVTIIQKALEGPLLNEQGYSRQCPPLTVVPLLARQPLHQRRILFPQGVAKQLRRRRRGRRPDRRTITESHQYPQTSKATAGPTAPPGGRPRREATPLAVGPPVAALVIHVRSPGGRDIVQQAAADSKGGKHNAEKA